MGRGASTLTWLRMVQETPGLPPRAKNVAGALAIHFDQFGLGWPGIERLMLCTGYKTGQPVRDGARDLEEAGFLDATRGGGRGNSNRYQATYPDTERVVTKHPFDDPERIETVTPDTERVHSEPETGRSEDPNSSELHKNSTSLESLEEARRRLGAKAGQSIADWFSDPENRRKILEEEPDPREEPNE